MLSGLMLGALICSPVARAQSLAAKRLSVESPQQITVKSGGEVVQILHVSVSPGYHVNSDHPKGEFLIPLKLAWSGDSLEALSIAYPKSEEIQVGPDRLSVFTGDFEIKTRFKAAANAPKGPGLVTGKLSYQACNNQMCFRPSSAEIRLPAVIE